MSEHKQKSGSTSSLHQKLQENLSEEEQEQLTYPSHEELEQKLTEAEEKASEYRDKMLRIQAEMDNLKKRVERDIESAHKYALDKFVGELLPIIDNFERAISHPQGAESTSSVLEGVQLTLKMFYTALEKFGVQQVNPENEPFNPQQHQAISTQVNPNLQPNTVVSVLQKGYLLNNRLIRPALVIVSKES